MATEPNIISPNMLTSEAGRVYWYFGSCSLAWCEDPPEELWKEMLLLLLLLTLLTLLLPWQHLADILIGTSSVF